MRKKMKKKNKKVGIKMKKMKNKKNKNKKIFTNEETKDTLGVITNLKAQINEKRKELDEIQKKSESKIHELLILFSLLFLLFYNFSVLYKHNHIYLI